MEPAISLERQQRGSISQRLEGATDVYAPHASERSVE
jgi:hypothetical protein